MSTYNPAESPLDLPFQRLLFRGYSDPPLDFPLRAGRLPDATLGGAFEAALLATACTAAQPCVVVAGAATSCRQAEGCVVSRLLRPWSACHRRQFATPVFLHAPELMRCAAASTFYLEVTLWGRTALAQHERIGRAVAAMGPRGLHLEGRRVPLHLEEVGRDAPLRLRDLALRYRGVTALELEFVSPFNHSISMRGATGRRVRVADRGEALDLARVLGEAVFEAVAWDLEERAEVADKRQRDDLADQARRCAQAACAGVYVTRNDLSYVDLGARRSSGGGAYNVRGFVGLAELQGDLESVLPWLTVLAVRGGGQGRAKGQGVVRLWGRF